MDELEGQLMILDALRHENRFVNELFWLHVDGLKGSNIPLLDVYEMSYTYAKEKTI